MLASSFLTAEALGITEPERAVLIEFHRRAASGEIPEERFDMGLIGAPSCGTAGCIMGWCGAIDAAAARSLTVRFYTDSPFREQQPLFKLFSGCAPHRTPSAAAEAVYRYLTTGKM